MTFSQLILPINVYHIFTTKGSDFVQYSIYNQNTKNDCNGIRDQIWNIAMPQINRQKWRTIGRITEEHKIAAPDPVYNIDRGNNCKQEQKDLPDPFYRRFVSAGCQNKHRNEH